jgi:DNA-binding SARP family transcriptional activator
MSKGGATPGSLARVQAYWHAAGELLKAGQYEQVAEILRQTQTASEQAGDAMLAHILDAASRICLACSQCRAQAEWHRQAGAEADRREQELREKLHAILDLASGRVLPEMAERQVGPPKIPAAERILPEPGLPKPEEHLSLWQRIHILLRHRLGPRPPRRGTATVSPIKEGKQPEQSPPSLAAHCLGPFRVYQNDQLITDWTGLKGQCILKYLVIHRGRPTAKDILMDVFWRDADPEAARRNLHQAIYSLRQTLRQGQPDFQHIQFENDCYSLNPEMSIWLDFQEFEKHVQAGRRLEAAGRLAQSMAEYGIAEGLYQGDFLEEDLYQDWPRLQREHIRNTHLDIADRLSEYYLRQGEYTAATALCQKVLAQENCHEAAHRRLMRCYLAQGQRHLAVRQYQTCVEALKEELDLTPAEETVALYRRITATA